MDLPWKKNNNKKHAIAYTDKKEGEKRKEKEQKESDVIFY